MANGKLIVLYGVNNLGKTTQARLLVEKLNLIGRKAKYLKYPVYDLGHSGKRLNAYLRHGNPEKLSAEDAQKIYAENRAQYETTLKADLESGIDIVAEDYWGTGVAWGMGAGVDKDFLLVLNKQFMFEDLAILLVGERFRSATEKNHLHETDEEFMHKVDATHRTLAKQFGWETVNANQDKEKVAEDIWLEVDKIIK
ncbi:MAG: hypothetical protein A2751_04830 [Candidatus Doudnabacteria bacterium RIFCSPHIGHO2_01_FULL_46_14]|uniref:Thymidylate kinase-like domain-containing protein n=1 Tax=Candidatus Doudnabacteria bacterium RIFCSPHIGHO2_01_FULL_46_14 TaxID=1817824 RepID=A0A1F5NNM1_9BACT|nr:MAG: hypothetical protein A2751_04830 [Candidatus Doudnabacteria bacterium RIFCSPHIGHO2_01_FULL_46_14]